MKLVVALGLGMLAACTGEVTGRYSQDLSAPPVGECGAVETHTIGVFQTPTGSGTIYLERAGKHVLVLSAHEKTTWHIKTAPGAELVHVYAVGFHTQAVDVSEANGHPTVKIDSMDKNATAACGYSWPYDGNGCDTDGLLQLAASRTKHDINSFAGCYEAGTWRIGKDMAATSDCAVSQGYVQDHFFSCDSGDTDGHCGSGDNSGSDVGQPGSDGGPVLY